MIVAKKKNEGKEKPSKFLVTEPSSLEYIRGLCVKQTENIQNYPTSEKKRNENLFDIHQCYRTFDCTLCGYDFNNIFTYKVIIY